MKAASMWLIDELQVVHIVSCGAIHEDERRAVPYLTTAKNADEMIINLARPDIANGHSAPSEVIPCDDCILALAGA